MIKPAFAYRNQTNNWLTYSVLELWERIDGSGADDPMKRVLRAANVAADATLGVVVPTWRKLGKRRVEEATWEFVKAFNAGPESVVPAHRLALWMFTSRYYTARWPDAYERLVGQAAAAVGLENDAEQRIALYGDLTGLARTVDPPYERVEADVDEDTQYARLHFRVIEGLLEVTLGRPIGRHETGMAELVSWQQAYAVGLDVFDDNLSSPELAQPLPA